MIVKAETVMPWQRKGFVCSGRGESTMASPGASRCHKRFGDLIRMLSHGNPRWGAPRIHGELLKLGIAITEPMVAKYMVRHPKPPSKTWRTFLKIM